MVTTRRGALSENVEKVIEQNFAVEKATASSGVMAAYPRVMYAVVTAIVKTIFASDFITTTNRTAVFLMFFLVVHCLGNLLVFLGADAFNAYGHLLHVREIAMFPPCRTF